MTLQEKEVLFAAFIDGELSKEQQAVFNELVETDSEFAARVETSEMLNNFADNFAAPPVPQWNKEATYFGSNPRADKSPWFSLPGIAMAMSACAMVVVLSGAQLSFNDSGIALTFSQSANQPSQAPMGQNDIDELVAKKVAEALGEQREFYQQANQSLFKEYAQALSSQQQQNSAELTKYLLASSREERKQDFAELLKFINDQRIDDQRFYARQFSRLQDEIDDMEMGYSAVLTPSGASGAGASSYPVNNTQPSLED
ncbi:anti-sigma factor family protein [Alteromonas sp. 009811495]|jgi:hypothetical protein|uniref:anti-sigma factor family protein n=1 Tax=Alteromonas sp. 009811495 TaxID=3002962 RepID=UPI00237DAC87|nr:hypothetical protein [Alteromonas sp. 009811495]WDT86940.1 hypothetical protein OZ660_04080 [Alteromonas sp. 009811495]